MEFMKCIACLLRALLTLTVLYGLNGRTTARSTAAPKDMDINTFVDDEDVPINQRREGVQFVLELLSKVEGDWCAKKSKEDVLMKQIRTHLLSDLSDECKCVKTSVSIISQEKMECPTSSDIHYSGEILRWTSPAYSLQQLAQFLDSWRPLLTIEGTDVNFDTIPGFNFTFNVTNSQTIMVSEDTGSGLDVNTNDNGGSGEMMVIEEFNVTDVNTDSEQNQTLYSLTDGAQGVHAAVGSTLSLITGVSLLLSFKCFI